VDSKCHQSEFLKKTADPRLVALIEADPVPQVDRSESFVAGHESDEVRTRLSGGS
jgi:hypothetical protein